MMVDEEATRAHRDQTIDRLQAEVEHCNNMLVDQKREADALKREVKRLTACLKDIANINNGPDNGSGEWRAGAAAEIARMALKGLQR